MRKGIKTLLVEADENRSHLIQEKFKLVFQQKLQIISTRTVEESLKCLSQDRNSKIVSLLIGATESSPRRLQVRAEKTGIPTIIKIPANCEEYPEMLEQIFAGLRDRLAMIGIIKAA